MKFVTAGGLRLDYLITREGKAYNGLPGGNALYAAAGAALWAQDVAPWARYGQNFPQIWLKTIDDKGLNTKALVALPGDQDHRTFFAYTQDGIRDDTNPAFHYSRIGKPLPEALKGYVHSTPEQNNADYFEPLAIRPSDWPKNFTDISAVHLAPLPLATHLHVPTILRQNNVELITVDPGERYMIPERQKSVQEILSQVDAFLPSDQEVRSLLGTNISLEQAAELFYSWGAPLVIIKVGARGVLLYDHGNGLRHLLPYHQPGDKRMIDVTGAGDAFCGGFIVGLAQSGDPIQAAQMGLVSASLTIEGYGALFALSAGQKVAQKRLLEIKARPFNKGKV